MRSIKRTEYIYHIKSLLLLGLPIIIGQLGNIITGLADTVMVGQHSTEELAAASFVNNVINAFIILGTGFSFNYTPIIGENIAVNKRIAIGGWLKNSLMANFTTTICRKRSIPTHSERLNPSSFTAKLALKSA